MKERLRKIANGVRAAVTSPEAVRQERSLAALVVVRLLLAAGASAELAQLVARLVHG